MRLEEEMLEQQRKEGKNAKKEKREARRTRSQDQRVFHSKMVPGFVQHLRNVPEEVCGPQTEG